MPLYFFHTSVALRSYRRVIGNSDIADYSDGCFITPVWQWALYTLIERIVYAQPNLIVRF